MRRSLYWKITLPFVLLALASMAGLGFFLAQNSRDTQIQHLESQLGNEARLVADLSIAAFRNGDDLQAIAQSTGAQLQARVTIIASDGTVRGDSEQDPATMENHSTRPEVVAALASGTGEATRYSATLHENMLYVATPITDQGQTMGVARVSLPLTAVEQSVNNARAAIISAIAIAAVLVVVATGLVSRMITSPVRKITEAAEALAAGRFDQRIPVKSSDEIGRLSRAFNDMSANVNRLVGQISNERTKLQTVLASLADGVIMTDAEGLVILVNRAAEGLFNAREPSAVGKPAIEVVKDHEIDNTLKACLISGQPQTARLEAGPSKRFLRVIAVPVRDAIEGGALLLFQDLTELRDLQTMRRDLIGNISHDLRTPIAGIKAMVETLKEGAIDDRTVAGDFLHRIDGEVDRLTQMVAELTQLSRIETGKADLDLKPVDLNGLVREVVTELTPLAERDEITIKTNLLPGLPPVPADVERMRQTLVNLVHNAIKFNRPGGSVSISTSATAELATMSISDTGVGISEEDLPHVFERFFKGDRARSGGGSGLGLAIAKHTVQAHGGEIRARSEKGKGSTFTISLPLKPKIRS